MATVKKLGCDAQQIAQKVKKAKKHCIDVFSSCKKTQDAAVALIHTCMAGDISYSS